MCIGVIGRIRQYAGKLSLRLVVLSLRQQGLCQVDAPADLRVVTEEDGDMPKTMRADLRELRLIDF